MIMSNGESIIFAHFNNFTLLFTDVSLLLFPPYQSQVRPPQPAVYFFVIDVSEPAIASGMLQHTANAIKAALDDIPGGDRTQIGEL